MRLIRLASETDFDGWRRAARALRLEGVAPADARWTVGAGEGEAVFYDTREAARAHRQRPPGSVVEPAGFSVPARFVSLAQTVFQHRTPERFGLLYRLLWRLARTPTLLDDLDDPDVVRARVLAREVFEGRNLVADAVISVSAAPQEPVMAASVVSVRAAKAAQRNARDGAYGCDAPAALEDVAAGVDVCRRCALWRDATQGVAGEGPAHAALMLVGEQPGDQEDLAGRPFVGPAGAVLDRALAAAGIARERLYVTNAVKHFKHELRGKRRLHKTPSGGEVEACRWWLEAERRLVRPRVIVALGATAALAVFGKPTPIAANRGRTLPLDGQTQGLVTYHPSYLLRLPDEAAKAEAYAAFVEDLKRAWGLGG